MTDTNAGAVKDALTSLASRPRFDADVGDVLRRRTRRARRVSLGGLSAGAAATVIVIASLVPLFARLQGSSHHATSTSLRSGPTVGTATPPAGLVTLPPGVTVPEGKLLLLVDGAEILRAGQTGSASLSSDLFPVAQDLYPLAMSPDGSEVLAQVGDAQPRQLPTDEQLVAVNVSTGRTTILWRSTKGQLLSSAAWSPDGAMVAFTVGTRDPGHAAALCIAARATGVSRCFPGLGDVYSFDWKPYGGLLVVAISATELRLLDAGTGRSSMIVMQHGDTSIDRAVAGAGLGRSIQLVEPRWSPDGRFLAALANLQGSRFAYVPVVFTSTGRFVSMGHPSGEFPEAPIEWSPAADTIAYTRGEAPYRITELWVLDVAAGQDRQVTGSNAPAARIIDSVAWSPSGGWIAAGFEPTYARGVRRNDGFVELLPANSDGLAPRKFAVPDMSGLPVVVAWSR